MVVAIFAGIATFTFPYQGQSISEMIIPVIKIGNIRIYLSGLIPLGLVIWSSHLIVKSGRFKRQFFVVLFLVFIALPVLGWAMNIIKTPVYIMSNGGRGIELRETELNVYGENMEAVVVFKADVTSYVDDESDVFIYVELPDVLHEVVEEDRILVYETMGLDRGRDFSIEYEGNLRISGSYDYEDFSDLDYYSEDYTIIVDDGIESYKITMSDSLF
jgi:hypothetical protein